MRIRYVLAVVFLVMGYFVHAQQVPAERTSATDGNVKVHGKSSSFRYDSRWRRSGRQVRSTEHAGQAVKKPKPHRSNTLNEAKVFKRHKHAAKKGTHLRARRHGRKHSMARR